MLKTLVDRLVCPECAPVLTTLTVHDLAGDQGVHVQTGVLRCERCARLFTIGVGGPSYDLAEVRDWVAWRDSL